MEREYMDYDVVIVGAGPAGLSAACRIKQINDRISVCVVEKGSEVGAHILSGAVFEPSAINELFPDWSDKQAPLITSVTRDDIYFMYRDKRAFRVPSLLAPKTMNNHGNFVISLGKLCRWLAEQAENMGVEIFPGFAASEILFGDESEVRGIITGDMGVGKDGKEKDSFMPGMELRAKYTLFAEGCRGHLGKQLISKYGLDEDKNPQHYGIGIKELWKIPDENYHPGLVIHSAGWPLGFGRKSTGGGFLYHLEENQAVVGLITDLSYTNPYLNPYDEFQRYKHHPKIAKYLTGGERLSYGARALTKGGLQSQPKMSFSGGLLIGDNAGTLNSAKIKGSHTAMKSGMLAAESIAQAIEDGRAHDDLTDYAKRFERSSIFAELHMQRNFSPALHKLGTLIGAAYAFVDINLFNGKLPWTLEDKKPDHQTLKPAAECTKIDYPKYDGLLSFDKSSSVFLSSTNHEEDQPCHLKLLDKDLPLSLNLQLYDEPAQRYCPAGVYEIISDDQGQNRFQINAQNCVHCKTCDIKEPNQNIVWQVPEGAGGPNYPNM